MKKRNIFLFILLTLTLFVYMFKDTSNQDPLELTEVDVISPSMGILEKELTFPTVMEQTSAVVVGEVAGVEKLNDTRPVFSVDVQEHIAGETHSDQVLVYIDEESIELNETYVFFLEPFDSSLYDELFYTQHSEFVIKVDYEQELWRLEDAFKKTYVRPFADQTVNTLDGLKKHIKANEKLSTLQEEERIEEALSNPQHLLDASDVVAEIKVIEVVDDRGIATISYELIKQYKGILDDNYLLITTNKIEKGEQYMIFLQERGGELTLTTRNNSILPLESAENSEFLLSIFEKLDVGS